MSLNDRKRTKIAGWYYQKGLIEKENFKTAIENYSQAIMWLEPLKSQQRYHHTLANYYAKRALYYAKANLAREEEKGMEDYKRAIEFDPNVWSRSIVLGIKDREQVNKWQQRKQLEDAQEYEEKHGDQLQKQPQFKTVDDGDCALHAALGIHDEEGFIRCPDIPQKRARLKEAILECKPGDNVYPLVMEGVKALIMSGHHIGDYTSELSKAYDEFLNKKHAESDENWIEFQQTLAGYSEVTQRIQDLYIEKHGELHQDFYVMFQDALSREDNELLFLMFSLTPLYDAWVKYNSSYNRDFSWDRAINDNLDKILKEYSNFLGRIGQWVLPSELALIAVVFNKTIRYYPASGAQSQILNPGYESVIVQFDGKGHFERVPLPVFGLEHKVEEESELNSTTNMLRSLSASPANENPSHTHSTSFSADTVAEPSEGILNITNYQNRQEMNKEGNNNSEDPKLSSFASRRL